MAVIELKQNERNIQLELDRNIHSEQTQKLCFVAEIIRKALNKYLDFDDLIARNSYSVYTLPIVNEEMSVIDFQINSLAVHVVPTIEKEENQFVYLPKLYKQYNYKPDLVIFVNCTADLTNINILGYVTDIDLNVLSIPKTNLIDTENLITALKTISPKKITTSENVLETLQELMLGYINDELSDDGRKFFLKHLLSNIETRKNYKLFYAMNCKFVAMANNKNIDTEVLNAIDEQEIIEDTIEDTAVYMEQEVAEEEIIEEKIDLESRGQYLQSKAIEEYNGNEEAVLCEDNDLNADLLNTDELSPSDLTLSEEIPDIQEPEMLEENHLEEHEELSDMPALDNLEDNSPVTLEDEFEDISIDDIEFEEDTQEEKEVAKEINSIKRDTKEDSSTIEMETLPTFKVSNTQENPVEVNNEEVGITDEVQQQNPQETQEIPVTENTEQNKDDDLFEFLSEISEEDVANQQAQVPVENTSEPIQTEEQPQNIQENIVDNTIAYTMPDLNKTFDNQDNIIDFAQNVQNNSPKKSTSKTILTGLCLCVVLAGYGAYMNKDLIMSKLAPILNKDSNEISVPDIPGIQAIDDVPQVPSAVAPAPELNNAENNNNEEQTKDAEAKKLTQPEKVNGQVPNPESLPALPHVVEAPKAKNINDAIANALSKDFNGVRINKVQWEISETLVSNPEVKQALTFAGRNIKAELSEKLLAATEPSFKDTIVVNAIYKQDGSLSKLNLASSSGSKQIDDIILDTVKSTLNHCKMPNLKLNTNEYTAKLIIKL